MPGRKLTHTESKLQKQWNDRNMSDGSLLSIRIEGEQGLRGLKNLTVDFRYPVTVISGRNGSGKTTLLSLAALAFNGQVGYFPKNAKKNSERGYYTFNHFFYKGPRDVDLTGIKIEWVIKNGNEDKVIRLKKQTNKWMKYERRPDRAVVYIGTSRLISAIELNVLKNHFKPGKKADEVCVLNDEYRKYLNYILSTKYNEATELTHRDYSIRTCQAGNCAYSSFNMGAGEDVVIELLGCIQKLPKQALCVIEEIELGIHPEAQAKLAEVLQEIAKEKQVQFIISSHSSDFIDALPRNSRIFLNRQGEETEVCYSPTTRYAMGKMSSKTFPEMSIFCEDEIAKKILECFLPNSTRKRVSIVPIGSKSELVRAYVFNRKANRDRFKGLIVWDGDVSDSNITSYLKSYSDEHDISYVKLHESQCPEKNILQTLLDGGIEQLTQALRLDSEAETRAILNELISLPDVHEFSYHAAQKTNMDEEHIVNLFISISTLISSDKYENLLTKIRSILDPPST